MLLCFGIPKEAGWESREKPRAETSQLFVPRTKGWFGVTRKKRSCVCGGKGVVRWVLGLGHIAGEPSKTRMRKYLVEDD